MARTKTPAAKPRPKIVAGPVCPDEPDPLGPTRAEYVEGLRQQIGAFEERLETLEDDMENSGWDDIANFRGRLDDLRVKLRELRSRTEELEAVADRSWPAAREEMEDALADAGGGIEDLAAVLSPVLSE